MRRINQIMKMNPATELRIEIEETADYTREAYKKLIELHKKITKVEERIDEDK